MLAGAFLIDCSKPDAETTIVESCWIAADSELVLANAEVVVIPKIAIERGRRLNILIKEFRSGRDKYMKINQIIKSKVMLTIKLIIYK